MNRGRAGRFLSWATCLVAFLFHGNPSVASITPELQQRVRAATFEVVIRKPEKDPLEYEKPLPLELIPFSERNDKYWPIGTAFAIGTNQYVSAAHVLGAGVGSQFGVPAIRDTKGNVYELDQVLKYSGHQDFVVFTVRKPASVVGLEISRDPKIDGRVFSVGNALGEGIVIRDGLLTSETPEAQDGRWSWLRFSAAASPGNSGGPLLDEDGRVIGVVTAKSPGENLNYALPIRHVLDGPTRAAFDSRAPFGLPILNETIVVELKHEFPLPLPYEKFATRFESMFLDFYVEQRRKFLESQREIILPRGKSAKLFAAAPSAIPPTLIAQQADKSWAHDRPELEEVELKAGGLVSWHIARGVTIFRARYPDDWTDTFEDAKKSLDYLLEGLPLPRPVGSEWIRVTSFGSPAEDLVWGDRFERQWRIRIWSLGYADAYVLALMLPTPDGFAGMLKVTQSMGRRASVEELKFLADYFSLTYSGSIPQWQSFLRRKHHLPEVFRHIRVDYEPEAGFTYRSSRLEVDWPPDMLKFSGPPALQLTMAPILEGEELNWDVGAIVLGQEVESSEYVAAIRLQKPQDAAGKESLKRWQDMEKSEGAFVPHRGHDDDWKRFWRRSAASASDETSEANTATNVRYELLSVSDRISVPREIDDIHRKLVEGTRIKER